MSGKVGDFDQAVLVPLIRRLPALVFNVQVSFMH